MGEFRMPSLGADMEAGTVIEWRVKLGDEVHRGDIVAVVDTDKADIDVEIFESGVIEELLVPVGERVAVGTPLARRAHRGKRPPCRVARPEPRPAAAAVPGRRRRRSASAAARRAAPLPRAPPARSSPGRGSGPRHGHGPLRPDHPG